MVTISLSGQSQDSLNGMWKFLPGEMDSVICKELGLFQDDPTQRAVEEEPEQTIFERYTHIYFGNDTLRYLEYPCEDGINYYYFTQNDSIQHNNGLIPQWYSISGDILTTTYDECLFQKYERMSYDQEVLDNLIDYGMNPKCMAGKFEIHTHFTPEYPVYDQRYEVIPPVKMPKYLNFKEAAWMESVFKSRTLFIHIGDKKRTFYLTSYNLCNWDQECEAYFEITSGEWWKGEPFTVQYRSPEE